MLTFFAKLADPPSKPGVTGSSLVVLAIVGSCSENSYFVIWRLCNKLCRRCDPGPGG